MAGELDFRDYGATQTGFGEPLVFPGGISYGKVSLDAGGNITPGSFGATITAAGITVGMQSATSTVFGTVAQQRLTGGAAQPLGEATVTLNSGTSSYTLTTASVPAPSSGRYRFDNVPPDTRNRDNPSVQARASLFGSSSIENTWFTGASCSSGGNRWMSAARKNEYS